MAEEESVKDRLESRKTNFLQGDDRWTRLRNTFSLLLGRLDDDGKAQYKKGRDDRHEESDCARCDKQKEYLLQYSTCSLQIL